MPFQKGKTFLALLKKNLYYEYHLILNLCWQIIWFFMFSLAFFNFYNIFLSFLVFMLYYTPLQSTTAACSSDFDKRQFAPISPRISSRVIRSSWRAELEIKLGEFA